MEKFTEFHEGNNKIDLPTANYLVTAYGIGNQFSNISIPVQKYIYLHIKAKLSVMRDILIIESLIYVVSVGNYSMAYPTFQKAQKGVEKLEDQHIESLFGAHP